MRTINGRDINEKGDPFPCGGLDSDNLADAMAFMPAVGQTITDNHKHTYLSNADGGSPEALIDSANNLDIVNEMKSRNKNGYRTFYYMWYDISITPPDLWRDICALSGNKRMGTAYVFAIINDPAGYVMANYFFGVMFLLDDAGVGSVAILDPITGAPGAGNFRIQNGILQVRQMSPLNDPLDYQRVWAMVKYFEIGSV